MFNVKISVAESTFVQIILTLTDLGNATGVYFPVYELFLNKHSSALSTRFLIVDLLLYLPFLFLQSSL